MDWKKIIYDLYSVGLTQAEISKNTGISQVNLSNAFHEKQKDMTYANGSKLVDFHRKQMRKAQNRKETA